MALSQPRTIFGVHSVSPYNVTTGEFYGTMKVLQGSSLSISSESVELTGGSQKYPYAVEDGATTAELDLKVSQYEDFMFELFFGRAPTVTSSETSGNVSTLTNKKGTSVMSATTGIASVTATSGDNADLKFGRYVVKAIDATHVSVYASTDADFGRGNAGEYLTDDLKIASSIAIASGAPTALAAYGITLTGGSGTIALVAGDTATFAVRPVNAKSSSVVVGASAYQTYPVFGAIIVAQKNGNGDLFEIDAYRCKGGGMPLGFEPKAFSEADIKVKLFYDAARNGVFEILSVTQ